MRFVGLRHGLGVAALLSLAGSVVSGTAFAQQVTYYDFDTPQSTPSQVSRQCSMGTAPAGTLFCFNDGTGQNATPSFFSDIYPPFVDPVTTDPPPGLQSTHYTVQMTPDQATQNSSMWFAVPQKVVNGFTSYFAFRFVPTSNSFATADGIAFVIQNSAGGGTASGCAATGAGLNIVGGDGGCIGYGGIDNSLAIELDTYRNFWDPDDLGTSNDDNHISIMNCGAGQPNSPDHTSPCQVNFDVDGVPVPALVDPPNVTLADGNVHQVVVEYAGETGSTPNLLQVYIDPPMTPGTNTPAPTATPVISGIYDIGANVNLMNSGTANDSAYVGFTAATGGGFEQEEILAWTFTPHAPSTPQQPPAPAGSPTVLPFGSNVYAVTYPNGSTPPPAGVDIQITATEISPALFSQLVAGGPFAGSQCQIYDDTGGNCVVYSSACINTANNTYVACPPAPQDNPITVKTAFDNTIQPTSPGFIQGDPFYSPVSTISGGGSSATVNCAGDCSVYPGQTITILGTSNPAFNGTVTVTSASPSTPATFTFASPVSGSATGGYLTSTNQANIFVSYSPQRIDGSISGKTLNFTSDFVATSVTTVPTMLALSAPSAPYGSTATVTVTATSGNGTPTGTMSLSVDSGTAIKAALSNGVATFKLKNLTGGMHTLSVSYPTTGSFQANMTSGSITITPIAPKVSLTGLPTGATRLENGQMVTVTATTNASTPPVFTSSGSCGVTVPNPSVPGTAQVTVNGTSGVCTIYANWAADSNYLAGSASETAGVGLTPTSMSFVSSLNPSAVGSPVLFTATVTGTGLPTSTASPSGSFSVTSSVTGDPSCLVTLKSAGTEKSAGACSLIFLTSGPRTVSAQYLGDTNYSAAGGSVPQSVQSGQAATIYPANLTYGGRFQNSVLTKTVVITNSGSAPLTISNPFVTNLGNGNSTNFVATNYCPASLAVGDSCSFYVTFVGAPGAATQTATLQIMDNAPNSPQLVPLSATLTGPEVTMSPNPVAFGTQTVGSTTSTQVKVTNNDTISVAASNISLTGPYASQFSQTNNCPASLGPGASCTITVNFKPTQAGTWTSFLILMNNAGGGYQQSGGFAEVMVSGTGN